MEKEEETFINVGDPNGKNSLKDMLNRIKENGGYIFDEDEDSIEITISITIIINK